MPRRDGTPTAEEAARARQPTTGQAAALAATAAAAAAVKPLQGSAAAQEALAQAAGSAAAGILKAFEGFLSFRLVELATAAADEIGRDAPSLSVEERAQILDDETRREKAFAAKARERVAGELPDLLRITDAKARQEAVRKLLDRERRFASQREDAMRERITASVGFFALRRGANARDELALTNGVPALFWRINPRLDNCVKCRAMANKAWPTSVLEVYRPPLHPACGCTLHLVSTALKMGWMTPSYLATRDDLPGGDILESVAGLLDVEPDALEMALMEARYDRRYPKQTDKAGQFRPRRGGIVGLRMHHAHHRGHFPGDLPAASPVTDASQATDVREIPTSSLKRGDQILVNGNLDEVHEVKGNGLFVMRDMGLVLIDREKVQGVAHDDRKAPVKTISMDRVDLRIRLARLKDAEVLELPNGTAVKAGITPGRAAGSGAERPYSVRLHGEWHTLIDNDRAAQAAIANEPRKKHTLPPDLAPRGAPDTYPHPTPPEPSTSAPPATGGPSYADIERHLLTPTIGSMPIEPGPLPVEGFAYLGKGEKVSYKRELRDGTLHLPDGFFRQGRDRREEVVFKHYGAKLTTGLGEDGLRQLAEQDSHLSDGKAVVNTYYALNSPARERMVELHPDAARLVATVAHEQGLPLHPDAAKLITAPKATDARPDQHPAHLLAERVNAAGETEGYGLLMEAGYNSTDANGPHGAAIWRSHEQGAEMHIDYDLGEFHVSPRIDTADQAPAQGLMGLDFGKARERFRGADGVALETNAHPWYEVVRPDGSAVALRLDGQSKVAQARAFTPAPAEVERARQIHIGRDPLNAIKPGDDRYAVTQALQRGGWSGSTPAQNVIDYTKGYGDDREAIRLRSDSEGRIVEIGRPDPASTGTLDEESYRRAQDAARQARADEAARAAAQADAAKKAQADKFASVVESLAAGKRPAMEGLPMRDVVVHLRDTHGWQVVTARRRGYRQGGGITYTLRSTDGDTLTFNGGATVEKVTKYKPAPKIARQRITGRAPANLDEFNGDALGRVDELAQRFDAVGAISTILYGNKRDHAAHREWNGTMVMGKEVKPSITRYLAKRAAGEPTTDEERLDFYSALQTVQHEINHGVTASGAQRTAENMRTGSFTPADYRGPGKGWEESLTEESAHLLATDWLRSYGMDEVLQAVRRHPSDRRVQGVYRRYRESLRSILDDAGIPDHERSQLILDMKFRMTPKQRLTAIGERLQANGHTRKDLRTGEQMTPDQEAYYRMTSLEREDTRLWREDWQPVVRPDLTDVPGDVTLEPGSEAMLSSGVTVKVVDVKPSEVVVETAAGRVRSMKPEDFYDPDRHGQMSKPIADGRHVIAGYRVWVQPGPHTEDGGEMEGRVVEVSTAGDYVKVETDDGLALWYATGRLK